MPSPFPGMDPFLEEAALFAGFHARLIAMESMLRGPRGETVSMPKPCLADHAA